jgi:hypothetical protein
MLQKREQAPKCGSNEEENKLVDCLVFVVATRVLPNHELTAQNRIKLTETESAKRFLNIEL